jgi:hypothetical protein
VTENDLPDLMNGPISLLEAVDQFQMFRTAILSGGKVTDLAQDTMNKAAKLIVDISADAPMTACNACRLIRSAARASVVLTEFAYALYDNAEDKVMFERGVGELNTEIVLAIVDLVLAHENGNVLNHDTKEPTSD